MKEQGTTCSIFTCCFFPVSTSAFYHIQMIRDIMRYGELLSDDSKSTITPPAAVQSLKPVPVHRQHRTATRFSWESTYYNNVFGLSVSFVQGWINIIAGLFRSGLISEDDTRGWINFHKIVLLKMNPLEWNERNPSLSIPNFSGPILVFYSIRSIYHINTER